MFTPNHIVVTARIAAGALAMGVIFLFLGIVKVDLALFATACFGLGALLLIAMPRRRSTDVLAATAIGFAVAECGAVFAGTGADGSHFAAGIAALLVLLMPLKLQRLRSMASRDGYMSFADWRRMDRRNRFNRSMELSAARGDRG